MSGAITHPWTKFVVPVVTPTMITQHKSSGPTLFQCSLRYVHETPTVDGVDDPRGGVGQGRHLPRAHRLLHKWSKISNVDTFTM